MTRQVAPPDDPAYTQLAEATLRLNRAFAELGNSLRIALEDQFRPFMAELSEAHTAAFLELPWWRRWWHVATGHRR